MPNELIVNLCPTGMIPTKDMTPHVPVEAEEIIEDILRCCDIGITMVHIHARNSDGLPSHNPDVYARIIEGIRKYCPDLVCCVSLSGRNFKEFDKRSAPLHLTGHVKPDMGSLTLSSLNFNRIASLNSPEMIKDLAECMVEKGILPELEVFDNGMINFAIYLEKKGLIRPPHYFNLLLGNIACAQPTMLHAGVMVNDLPTDSYWSFAGIGNAQLKMNALSIVMGGGVRVGLEDNIWYDEGRTVLATNEKLVKRIKLIADEFNRKIMKPETFREKIGLSTEKGKYGVKNEFVSKGN